MLQSFRSEVRSAILQECKHEECGLWTVDGTDVFERERERENPRVSSERADVCPGSRTAKRRNHPMLLILAALAGPPRLCS
jgi:hypothetical protein